MRSFRDIAIGDLVRDGYVAPHPEVARQRIERRCECVLSADGLTCTGISSLRAHINQLDPSQCLARSLFIAAAHTHWGERRIVESFDSGRNVFLAGPVEDERDVYPISFVFTAAGPVPYEWADRSVPAEQSHLDKIYDSIELLNGRIASEWDLPIPLGVTLNHRFKNTPWEPNLFSFAEGPQNEESGRAVIRPVFESVLIGRPNESDQIQVAWSALPPSTFDRSHWSPADLLELERLEECLRTLTPAEAVQFFQEAETVLDQ